ncbi:MAG: hypothetical protein H6623_05365 [Bdellovibrionaceae bacterium]|nr:hypothetical protein [Pseudobdellovibrionaceae bacterium]
MRLLLLAPSILISGCASTDPTAGWASSGYRTITSNPQEIHEQIGPLDESGNALPYNEACDEQQRTAYLVLSNSAVSLMNDFNSMWMKTVQEHFPSTRGSVPTNTDECVRNPTKYFEPKEP